MATFPTVTTPYTVGVGDFNNDNRMDIVISSYNSNSGGVFLGYGNGSIATQMTFSTGYVQILKKKEIIEIFQKLAKINPQEITVITRKFRQKFTCNYCNSRNHGIVQQIETSFENKK